MLKIEMPPPLFNRLHYGKKKAVMARRKGELSSPHPLRSIGSPHPSRFLIAKLARFFPHPISGNPIPVPPPRAPGSHRDLALRIGQIVVVAVEMSALEGAS